MSGSIAGMGALRLAEAARAVMRKEAPLAEDEAFATLVADCRPEEGEEQEAADLPESGVPPDAEEQPRLAFHALGMCLPAAFALPPHGPSAAPVSDTAADTGGSPSEVATQGQVALRIPIRRDTLQDYEAGGPPPTEADRLHIKERPSIASALIDREPAPRPDGSSLRADITPERPESSREACVNEALPSPPMPVESTTPQRSPKETEKTLEVGRMPELPNPPALQLVAQLGSTLQAPQPAIPGDPALATALRPPDHQHITQPNGVKALRISLRPEDLGDVEVTLRRAGSEIKVHITVARRAAADLLARDLGLLEDKLGVLFGAGTGPAPAITITLQPAEHMLPKDQAFVSPSEHRGNGDAAQSSLQGQQRDGRSPPGKQDAPIAILKHERGERDEAGSPPRAAAGGSRVV